MGDQDGQVGVTIVFLGLLWALAVGLGLVPNA